MQPDQTPNVLPLVSPEASAVPEQMPGSSVPEIQPAIAAAPPVAPLNLPTIPVVIPVPNPVPPPLTVAAAPVASMSTSPVLADDVDVIEKEWVDAADRVIKQTAGDPYTEEEAAESLQIDYLKKRYGHDVKKTESS